MDQMKIDVWKKKEIKFIKCQTSYKHSSSGSSSNIEKHSSIGSSNANGNSDSGSSNNGRSSTNLSNDDYSDDPESYPVKLGDFAIFLPAYYFMRSMLEVQPLSN